MFRILITFTSVRCAGAHCTYCFEHYWASLCQIYLYSIYFCVLLIQKLEYKTVGPLKTNVTDLRTAHSSYQYKYCCTSYRHYDLLNQSAGQIRRDRYRVRVTPRGLAKSMPWACFHFNLIRHLSIVVSP